MERSGYSHAMNFHTPVFLKQESERSFRVRDAYPVDCANIAFRQPDFPSFDLVISGINHGPNLGDDIHYSGTVAVARQAIIKQVRGIAISSVKKEPTRKDMLKIAEWLYTWVQTFYSELNPDILYNINYPEHDIDIVPQVCYSRQGRRFYGDSYEDISDDTCLSRGEKKLQLVTQGMTYDDNELETDLVVAIKNRNISITPLGIKSTHIPEYERLLSLQN